MRLFLFLLLFSILTFASDLKFSKEEKEFIRNHKIIKIASIKSYIPFSFEKNGEQIGLTHDLIDLISKKSGLKFKKISGSWSDIYNKFEKNEIDIISEISYKKDRVKFTKFTNPYYNVPIGVFTKGFIKYEGIKSLEGKRVGILKGSFFIPILKDLNNIKIYEYKSEKEKLFSLLKEETDFIISNALSVTYSNNLIYKDIKLSGYFENEKINKEDLRFGIRKENKLLSSIFIKTFNSISFSQITKLKDEWIYSSKVNKKEISLNQEEKDWIENNEISVGIESAKPYIYFDKTSKDINGFYADIFKLLIKKTNLKVNYKKDTWSNLLKRFKNNEIDLLPATFHSKDREKFGLFTTGYYNVREYIYTKLNSYIDFTNLNNKKIAIVKGYATIQKLKENFPDIQIIETENIAQSINLVLNEEVDGLIDYHLVVENFLLDNSIIGLKGLAQTYLDSTSVHYFSQKDKPILNSILQKGLESISREEKNRLFRLWFSDQYKEIKENFLSSKEKEFIKKHKIIRFAINPNRPPYEFVKNGKILGLTVDYIKESAKKVGLNVDFIINEDSVEETYNEIKNKREKYDTMSYSVKTKEREKEFSYGIEYLSYPMVIITHKDANFVTDIKKWINKTIVLEEGYLTNKWIKRDYPNIKIINAKDSKTALKMVNENKDIAYIGNLGVANHLRTYEGLENIKVIAPSKYGYIKFSFIAPKQWPELSSILSKGYEKISPAEHNAIQQKWFSMQKFEKDYSLILKILLSSLVIILWILWWNRKLSKEKDKTKIAISELQNAKKLLEEKNKEIIMSQRFLESVLDESPNPIIIKNYDNKFILVNDALAKLYNTKKEDLIGKDDGAFIDDKEMVEFFRKNVKDIMDKGESQIVYEDSKNVYTGETRNFMSIKKPFKDLNGNKLILIIANDITEIKKLEDEKLKNQELIFNQSKAAAMGEMIGNIAHQWRQPLSIISTASTGLIMENELKILDDKKLIKTLNSINDTAQHLSNTIETFRDYIKDTKEFQSVILQDRIKIAINIVNAAFKNSFIKINTNIDKVKPIKMKLILGELSEVLINILNNSKDVLEERKIKEPWVNIQIERLETIVSITIEDNGGGIDEKIIERIFEPYFTTKHKSQGTGLGLHMSYKIITESLKGNIFVKNTKNGAKFFIELPLIDKL